MRLKLPLHVHGFVDRHGKPRHYLRKPGSKLISLPGIPYSIEFMDAYQAGLHGNAAVREIGSERTKPGTVNAAIVGYYNSEEWALLKPSTQKARRNILSLFRKEHGDKRISKLTKRPLAAILAKRKPFAAKNWLKTLRGLCQYSVTAGLMSDDPTLIITLKKTQTSGFHSWTDQEIEQFEKHHAVGTTPRLALGLLLYTSQRRSDVVRLGRQHIRNGTISVRQDKTGTDVTFPVHTDLLHIIESTPSGHLNFLVTKFGKPFSAAGFGNWFADRCDEAGMPRCCRAHGLRKAACRRLAEAGATAPEIVSISGHLSLKEVERYIAAADRKIMARSGMEKVQRAFSTIENENSHSQTGGESLQIKEKIL